MTDEPTRTAATTAFQHLNDDQRQVVITAIEATVECLKEYARMMEAGEMASMAGPEALRAVADLFEFAWTYEMATSGNRSKHD